MSSGLTTLPGGLRHLLVVDEQPAADGVAPGQVDAGRHQHRRPVDAVEADDVLADDVHVDRPPAFELRLVGGEADGAEVVGERVEPHVGDVLGVPRERHAPLDAGAAHREVAQAGADDAERLVAAELGHDRAGVGVVPRQQPVAEAGEAEEVVLLLELVDGRLVDRAQAAGQQLVVGVVRLAAHAVLAAVVVELDVAGVVAALQQLGDRGVVARLGGADEVVVGDVEPRHAAAKRGAIPSANSFGPSPAAVAACWIFWPCSSVPVRNLTSSPSRRCQRASASPTIVE